MVDQRDNFGVVGVPHKWTDTVPRELENLFSGSYPEVSGQDFPAAPDQEMEALKVVALNGAGRLVEAQVNPGGPGAIATGTVTVTGATHSGVTINGTTYETAIDVANTNENRAARATELARLINNDPYGACYGTASAAAVSLYAREPGSSGNNITLAVGTNVSVSGSGTLVNGSGGDVPLGIVVQDYDSNDGNELVGVYLTGVFNPNRLKWHASFNTDRLKRMAFANVLTRTQITIRKIQANTVSGGA